MDILPPVIAIPHARERKEVAETPQICSIIDSGGAEERPEMWGLAVLPLEVLHYIFVHVDLRDTLALSLTCRQIRDSIKHDDLLWKAQYLKLFNEPTDTPAVWRSALRDLLVLRNFLEDADRTAKDECLADVANTAIKLATGTRDANPVHNQEFLADLMLSRSNRSCFLSRSSLFKRAGHPLDIPADTEALRQLSAKLYVYYNADIELKTHEMALVEGSQKIHPYARSRVYDLQRYTTKNDWGPLMDDGSGRVDWEKVQAITTVLHYGVSNDLSDRFETLVKQFWGRPFHGLAANSFSAKPFGTATFQEAEADELGKRDPYNITGTWLRVVNFLDYHDLFAYNFQQPAPPRGEERPPIYTKEAIRLIWMELNVTKIEEPQDGDDPTMPRVHFKGVSRSLTNSWDPNANSGISGYVRKTIHGDIRWTSISIVEGEERWRSECVQIGEANSARGTVGNWFDKNYDPHGPAGPTAFWKVSNGFVQKRDHNHSREAHLASNIMNYHQFHLTDDEEDDEEYEEGEDGVSHTDLDEEGEDDEDDESESGGHHGTDTFAVLHGNGRGLFFTITDGVVTSWQSRQL